MIHALLERHLNWLRPRTRTATPATEEPPTLISRRRLLLHAHNHLPYGLLQASDEEIGAYLSAWSGWSRYTYDGHLRGFYRWAARQGHLTLDPMAELPKPRPGEFLPHPCEDHELALALAAPPPYGRAILLAARAGLRCGEIARARRRHLSGRRLRVVGKGGKERTVPLDDETATAIECERDWLLGVDVTPDWLTEHQRPVWRRLGLPESFRLHSARHWYATRLLETGATLREVQTALGHSSPVTTAGYTLVTDARLATAVSRLPTVRAAGPIGARPRRSAATFASGATQAE